MIEIGLLLVAITLLGAILYLQLNDEDPEKVRGAVSESWRNLKLDKEIGQIESQVSEIKDLHTDLETMMKNPNSGRTLNVEIIYDSGALFNLSASGTVTGNLAVDQDITVTGPPEEGCVPAAMNQLQVNAQ